MSLPTPRLDDRSFDDLVEEARGRILRSCPQWTDFNHSDPGMTLVDVMAWMTELILYRLNRVPDRNYIKFLDLMGVRLGRAIPARAWIHFVVQDDLAGPPPPVPAGTVLRTERAGGEDPLPFETTETLHLAPARLIQARSVQGEQFSDHTPGLERIGATAPPQPGPPGPMTLFQGTTQVPHVLFLRDGRLDVADPRVASTVRLRLVIGMTGGLAGPVAVEWERWDGVAWSPLPPMEDGTHGLRTSGEILFEKLPKPIDPGHAEVRGAFGHSITGPQFLMRARLVGGVAERLPALTSLQYRVEVNPARPLYPTRAIHQAPRMPAREVDPSQPFAPFGVAPGEGDTLYIRSAAFGRPDADVTIDVRRVGASDSADHVELAWEYPTPIGDWKPLGRIGDEAFDNTHALTRGGRVRFKMPKDIAPTAYQGEPAPWIRVRVVRSGSSPSGPMVDSLTVQFADPLRDWRQYVSVNYGAREDLTKALVAHRSVRPFSVDAEGIPTLYLGLSRSLPPGPQRLYFALAKRSDAPDVGLRWAYLGPDGWTALQVVDGTRAFSQNGAIEFIAPPADRWSTSELFGTAAAWLRCRYEVGDMRGSAELRGVYPNVVEAVQGRSLRGRVLGSSTGEPFQSFRIGSSDDAGSTARPSVLPGSEIQVRETLTADERRKLRDVEDTVTAPDATSQGVWVRWCEVDGFYESRAQDRHYTLDPHEGLVTFGDGKRGMIPPPGANNIKANVYQVTAGSRGNVGRNMITVLDGSLVGVRGITNVEPSEGGADEETIEDVKLRGPYELKRRDRAVTVEDFEHLAMAAAGAGTKARCFADHDGLLVVVVPDTGTDRPRPQGRLIRQVEDALDARRLLTTKVRVIGPYYEDIALSVNVVPQPPYVGRFPDLVAEMRRRLVAFVHPHVGGPSGKGWPMGRTLHQSELYYLLNGIPGVDYVDRLAMGMYESADSSPQDNIYLREQAFPFLREITINQVEG